MDAVKQYAYPAIERWMAENHITQRDLAKKSGYNKRTVCGYLLGDSPPSYYFILTVLEMSGMTFEEAFLTRNKEDE